jgi:hypothetical protein
MDKTRQISDADSHWGCGRGGGFDDGGIRFGTLGQ